MIIKTSHRDDLVQCKHLLCKVSTISDLLSTQENIGGHAILLEKWCTKYVQRYAIMLIPPRNFVSWRYHRLIPPIPMGIPNSRIGIPHIMTGSSLDSSARFEISDELESSINFLLRRLGSKDTVVRWSSAKGMARIAARLPRDLARDVLNSVKSLFEDGLKKHQEWHGGCLVLAEFVHHGVLLPDRLGEFMSIIWEALVFDQRVGSFTVGSQVRDAACYVLWSCARTYDADVFTPYLNGTVEALLTMAVFDREVSCRRAASAALQELVGRYSAHVPHGIDLVTQADYFSIGSQMHAYLDVAPNVAHYIVYRCGLLDHLVKYKIGHVDSKVRSIAAKAFGKIVCMEEELEISNRLRQLDRLCRQTGSNFEIQHGCLLAISSTLSHMYAHRMTLDHEMTIMLYQLSSMMYTTTIPNSFYDSHNMVEALCQLIDTLSTSALDLSPYDETVRVWIECIEELLSSVSEERQVIAAQAFTSLYRKMASLMSIDIVDPLYKIDQ